MKILSSLVEELLHVLLHVDGWVQNKKNHSTSWEEHFHGFCRRFYDEYFVGRAKVPMLAGLYPPPETEDDNKFSIFYRESLAAMMNEGVTKLNQLILDYDAGNIELLYFWNKLNDIFYRNFFEPLARDAAFRDGNSSKSPIDFDAHTVDFFQKVVKQTWEAIYQELSQSFIIGFSVNDEALQRMTDGIIDLFERIGISFQQIENEDWLPVVNSKVYKALAIQHD